MVKVDVDQAPRLGQRFEVRAVPTLLVLRDGEVAARQAGAAPVPALRRWLDEALTERTLRGEGAVMKRHDLAWQLPLRLTAGTFVLDSGLRKRDPDEETAKHLHGFASGAYPFLAAVEPVSLTKALAAAELLIRAALVIPVVPARLAALGLLGFGAGLLGLYAPDPRDAQGPARPCPPRTASRWPRTPGSSPSGRRWCCGDRR